MFNASLNRLAHTVMCTELHNSVTIRVIGKKPLTVVVVIGSAFMFTIKQKDGIKCPSKALCPS